MKNPFEQFMPEIKRKRLLYPKPDGYTGFEKALCAAHNAFESNFETPEQIKETLNFGVEHKDFTQKDMDRVIYYFNGVINNADQTNSK